MKLSTKTATTKTVTIAMIAMATLGSTAYGMGKSPPRERDHIHPDLRVDPIDFRALQESLDAEIAKIRSELQPEDMLISIPDFKDAQSALNQEVGSLFSDYLETVANIGVQVRRVLSNGYSRLAALKSEAEKDSTGVFSQLLDVEIEKFIKRVANLSKNINEQYVLRLAPLLTLGDRLRIIAATPRSDVRVLKEDLGGWDFMLSYGGVDLRDQYGTTTHLGHDKEEKYRPSSVRYSYAEDNAKSRARELADRFVKAGDYAFKYNSFQTAFSHCATAACVAMIAKDLENWLYFAQELNKTISFNSILSQRSFWYAGGSKPIKHNALIAAALWNAARGLLNDSVTANEPYSVPQLIGVYLKKAIETPAGIAAGILAVPVAILEETALFADRYLKDVMGSRYAKLSVELREAQAALSIEKQIQLLRNRADALMREMPTAEFNHLVEAPN